MAKKIEEYTVSVVGCSSYNKKDVKTALEKSLVNINFSFKKNLKVLIKPNLLGAHKPEAAITTHPAIIEELCKILKKNNAKVYIGDSSAFNTNQALETCGMKKLSKYGRIINFESLKPRFFLINGKRTPLTKLLFDVDLVLNVAKMKTHGLTQVTLCIKNLYGCIPGQSKENNHKKLHSSKRFSEFLVKLHEKIKPQLNIIDGIIGLEGEGPGASGTPINSKLIIASKNAFAADIIASEIMGFSLGSIHTNKFSGIERKDIEVFGDKKNIKVKFAKPKTYFISSLMFLSNLIPTPKIKFDKDKCIKCGVCSKKCPMGTIKLDPWPFCNYEKCIRCLCCIEVCKSKAVYLKEHFIREEARKLADRILKF